MFQLSGSVRVFLPLRSRSDADGSKCQDTLRAAPTLAVIMYAATSVEEVLTDAHLVDSMAPVMESRLYYPSRSVQRRINAVHGCWTISPRVLHPRD